MIYRVRCNAVALLVVDEMNRPVVVRRLDIAHNILFARFRSASKHDQASPYLRFSFVVIAVATVWCHLSGIFFRILPTPFLIAVSKLSAYSCPKILAMLVLIVENSCANLLCIKFSI